MIKQYYLHVRLDKFEMPQVLVLTSATFTVNRFQFVLNQGFFKFMCFLHFDLFICLF